MKTRELTGTALDWVVAKCEGGTDFCFDGITWGFKLSGNQKVLAKGWAPAMSFCPSTDWAQGGPIIEREKLSVTSQTNGHDWAAKGAHNYSYGPTPLIAALRCFVASKLGDDVEIPEELK